jgi:hypothetical protein
MDSMPRRFFCSPFQKTAHMRMRWLQLSSLHRIPTPMPRCWMSHLQALSPSHCQRQTEGLVHGRVDVIPVSIAIRLHRHQRLHCRWVHQPRAAKAPSRHQPLGLRARPRDRRSGLTRRLIASALDQRRQAGCARKRPETARGQPGDWRAALVR